MTHKEREAEADRLMAILRGDGDATLITETGELQSSPDDDYYEEYRGMCHGCEATLTLERPDAFRLPSGEIVTDLPMASVIVVMRETFERLACPRCGQRTVQLISPV